MEETQTNSISSSDQSKRLSAIFHDGWETLDVVEEHPDPNSIEYKVLVLYLYINYYQYLIIYANYNFCFIRNF